MKVVQANVYLVEVTGRHPVLVEVLTDEGVSGVGEAGTVYGAGWTAAAGMVKDLVERFLLGADPFRIEALWVEMYDHSFWAKGGGPIVFAGISAIEQALWDIKGKALGVPVYEMLGGKCRDDVRVYANGWSFHCDRPGEFAREAERVVADGFDALKLYPLATRLKTTPDSGLRHVSRRSIDREAEDLCEARVRAVRSAVGPKVDIMLDMSASVTPEVMLRLARRLEELDIAFIEEPVDPFDVDALKWVHDQACIPVAVGERLYTRYGFRRVLELHAADILQPDIGYVGGILEAKKVAAMAEAYSMRVQPHLVCASPVSTAAALQFDACVPNFYIHEHYPYRGPEHHGLVDHAPELDLKDGHLPIPTRPGLGVELVAERVRPFLWAECKR
jgi:galactonate dehydratase